MPRKERVRRPAPGAARDQVAASCDAEPRRARRWLPWLVLGLILVFQGAVRARLADFPMERDEGEYAYNAQRLLEGVPPYRSAYASQKLPGAYFASAAALALCSEIPEGLRLGLALANVASTLLLFALMRRFAGDLAALAAAAAFALLAAGAGVLGFAAHATHFVTPPVLGGMLVLHGACERERARVRLFLAGLLFGSAILVRQPAAAFALFSAAALAASDRRAGRACLGRVALFSAGVVAPFALLCAWLWAAGVFPTFWFWTVTYAREYGSQVSWEMGWDELRSTFPGVVGPNLAIWLTALAGLAVLSLHGAPRVALAGGWLAASALAVGAGLYFRNHYFVQVLPVVAALFGLACAGPELSAAATRRWRRAASVVASIVLGVSVASQRDYLFRTAPVDLCRSIYRGNLFVEIEATGGELRRRSAPEDTLAVIGSEPQLYAYAHRRAATGFLYTYALMEESPFAARFQDDMVREIESARPRFVVVVDSPASWLVRERSSRRIFDWTRRFVGSEYRQIGLVTAGDGWFWDEALRTDARPREQAQILVYERR